MGNGILELDVALGLGVRWSIIESAVDVERSVGYKVLNKVSESVDWGSFIKSIGSSSFFWYEVFAVSFFVSHDMFHINHTQEALISRVDDPGVVPDSYLSRKVLTARVVDEIRLFILLVHASM